MTVIEQQSSNEDIVTKCLFFSMRRLYE